MRFLRLDVVRDKNNVKDRIREGAGDSQVITASQFFDQIRLTAYLASPQLVQDDQAAHLVASTLLIEDDPKNLHLSFHYARLLNSVVHGRSSPSDIRAALGDQNPIFDMLERIESKLSTLGVLNAVSSLSFARDIIATQKRLPGFLNKFSQVCFHDLIDLTELELETIMTLAELGLNTQVRLPMDAQGRGITLPVSYLADRFEKRHDLTNIEVDFVPIEGEGSLAPFVDALWGQSPCDADVSEHVHVCVASDVVREARWVAQAIAELRARSKQAPTIALALRTLDARAIYFRDALTLHGIKVRERKGQTLLESPLAQLISHLLYAKAQDWPKERLLAILSHPLLNNRVSDLGRLSQVQRHLQEAALRSDVEDVNMPTGSYLHRLRRLLVGAGRDDSRSKSIERCIDEVQNVLRLGEPFAPFATLARYRQLVLTFIETQVERDSLQWQRIRELLVSMGPLLEKSKAQVSLLQFTKWFEQILSRETLPPAACDDPDAVELLPIPELLGRKFDYVAIVDMVHGRLPKAQSPDPLLKDSDRFEINRLMKAPVLKLFEENPLEASVVPPRQAREPLLFVGACAAAQRGLILSASTHDESGRDMAKSEFLDASLLALGLDPETFEGARTTLNLRPNSVESRFASAKYWNSLIEKTPDVRLELFADMARQRKKFFTRASSVAPEQVAESFSFRVDSQLFRRRFERRLGLQPGAPLTPTLLEGIAYCRYRGFLEKMLKIDANPEPSHDMDARTMGRLAHEVLEVYYQSENPTRELLSSTLQRLASRYLSEGASGHQGVLGVYIAWLDTALQRLVSNLERNPPVENVAPHDFELAIGTGGPDKQSLLGSVPILVGGEALYFGGIIDRVDEGPKRRVVVDYKTSKGTAIKDKVSNQALFVTHFQLPLYLRLLEHHRPTTEDTQLLGYLVSIREGTVSDVLGQKRFADLRTRILNDEAEEGLAMALHRVLGPVLQGVVPPDVGERCKKCLFKRVCRIGALEARGADDDESEAAS